MMVTQSRSARASKTSAGQSTKDRKAPTTKVSQHTSHIRSHTNNYASADGFDEDGRPSKKRKLDIRHKQTTLDRFAIVQGNQLKPPTKVTAQKPQGKLFATTNGVRTTLNATEDELEAPVGAESTPNKLIQSTTNPARSAEKKKEDKRTLRSQDDGPRLKSELATYFPNYEDVIFDVHQNEEFITVDTVLYVTDDPRDPKSQQSSPAKGAKGTKGSGSHVRNASINGTAGPTTPQRSNTNQLNTPSESLEMIARTLPDRPEDPLTDAHFFKSHRRAERKEKQLRNIERERAMHEKVQLDRLLDGLQGHDWLKVLGITGITDGEAKKYEPKRDYFIAEVEALVEKFRIWKDQEKKQRLERDAAAAAAREAESEERESEEGSVDPPSSDLNASAARQLQQETVNAMKAIPKLKLTFNKDKAKAVAPTPPSQPAVLLPPSPEVPISSFYKKRHLRDAALGKLRHGRNATAFGHAIPTLDESEFSLPANYATEDALRSNARERRRRNRASLLDASSG